MKITKVQLLNLGRGFLLTFFAAIAGTIGKIVTGWVTDTSTFPHVDWSALLAGAKAAGAAAVAYLWYKLSGPGSVAAAEKTLEAHQVDKLQK